jgi:hypothetical protein
MSEWRIQRQYGFGAARVYLQPQPHFVSDRALSLMGGLRDAGADFYLSTLPPLILAAFVSTALFVTVSKDRGYTDLEVAMIQREVLELAEEIPEPPPVVTPEPPPPPPPVKKVVKKPEPPPPVQKIAKVKPKPPPAARPKPTPKRAKPKPVVRPQIDALAMAPVEKPPPPPPRRGNRVRERAVPKPALAPLGPAPVPALKQAEPNRSRRFASVRAPKASSRPKADLGPPIAARPMDAPAPEPAPVRTRRAAPRTASEKRQMARVSFAGASAPPPAAAADFAPSSRRSRPVAKPDRSRRAAPPSIQPALAAAVPTPKAQAADALRRSRDRTERNASTRRGDDRSGARALAGVPLASLAACVSDREEDALKRKLVAAVTAQRECVSRAGVYRFVETKNLNAFLMTIERAPDRPVADRCAELTHALECVTR